MFILDDAAAAAAGLPSRYGVDDVPLLVQDRRFDDDGRFDLGAGLISPTGILGDEILVNGTLAPYLDVRSERVRLRLLNASNARIYDFGFSDNRQFALVATDGGLLARPHHVRRVMLSPGERAEIVVTLRPGERTVLRSTPPDLGTGGFDERFAGGDDRLDILQLRAAEQLRPSPPVPNVLAGLPRLDERAAKDTVYLPPRRTLRLIVPFGSYADPHMPYMFHCHLLRHEDQGMMGQFVVTAGHSHPAPMAHRP